MRVPLIMHFPENEFAGLRIDTPVSLVDLMPTLLDYHGRVNLCDGCRGESLMDLISSVSPSESASNRRVVGMRLNAVTYYRPDKESRGDLNVFFRRDEQKGIWNMEPDSVEIYDLAAERVEGTDLSAGEQALANEYAKSASAWLQSCMSQSSPSVDTVEMDEESRAQLRALGYLN
jgi:choline-sulfatase